MFLGNEMREYFENSSYADIAVKSEAEGCLLVQNIGVSQSVFSSYHHQVDG